MITKSLYRPAIVAGCLFLLCTLFLGCLYAIRSDKAGPPGTYCLAFSDAFWWTCLNPSEWAAWAQAAGAVAAICAAIMIATNEARERRKEAMARAHSVRPATYLHLTATIDLVDQAIATVKAIRENITIADLPRRNYSGGMESSPIGQSVEIERMRKAERWAAYEKSMQVTFPSSTDTKELGPLKNFAELFSNGQVTLFQCQTRLKAFHDSKRWLNATEISKERDLIVEELDYVKGCFEAARQLCGARV